MQAKSNSRPVFIGRDFFVEFVAGGGVAHERMNTVRQYLKLVGDFHPELAVTIPPRRDTPYKDNARRKPSGQMSQRSLNPSHVLDMAHSRVLRAGSLLYWGEVRLLFIPRNKFTILVIAGLKWINPTLKCSSISYVS